MFASCVSKKKHCVHICRTSGAGRFGRLL